MVFWRSSIMRLSAGHTTVATNQMNRANQIICPMMVALMFTLGLYR